MSDRLMQGTSTGPSARSVASTGTAGGSLADPLHQAELSSSAHPAVQAPSLANHDRSMKGVTGAASRTHLGGDANKPVAPGIVQRLARSTPSTSANKAVVQLDGEGPSSSGSADQAGAVHSAASRGVATAAGSLPHLDKIQQSFGHHDISSVRAHTGPEAATACKDMSAKAFATSDHVVFSGRPDLHTTAHEAAHIVQQRAGVSLKGGVGKSGDKYEQHAERVADAVTQGKSAEGLLDQMAPGGSSGAASSGAGEVQRFYLVDPSTEAGYRWVDNSEWSDGDYEAVPWSTVNSWGVFYSLYKSTAPPPPPVDAAAADVAAPARADKPAVQAPPARAAQAVQAPKPPPPLPCTASMLTALLKDDSLFVGRKWSDVWSELQIAHDFSGVPNAMVRLHATWKSHQPGKQADESDEKSSASAAGRAPYKFDDPNTWDILPPRYTGGVNAGDIDIDMTGLVLPQHGGAQVGRPFHKHIQGGNGGVAFHYEKQAGARDVQLVVYDIAPSRHDNDYNWTNGGRRGGPPPIP